MGNVTRRVANK